MTKGGEIEIKLDTLKREAARRGKGQPASSTAALATDLYWDIVRHWPGLSVSTIQRQFGGAIAELTGIKAKSHQRALIDRARKHKGMELLLFTPASNGPDAIDELRQITAEAEAQYKAKVDAHQENCATGGANVDIVAMEYRDTVVTSIAASKPGLTTSALLVEINAELEGQGLGLISNRTLRRTLNKTMPKL